MLKPSAQAFSLHLAWASVFVAYVHAEPSRYGSKSPPQQLALSADRPPKCPHVSPSLEQSVATLTSSNAAPSFNVWASDGSCEVTGEASLFGLEFKVDAANTIQLRLRHVNFTHVLEGDAVLAQQLLACLANYGVQRFSFLTGCRLPDIDHTAFAMKALASRPTVGAVSGHAISAEAASLPSAFPGPGDAIPAAVDAGCMQPSTCYDILPRRVTYLPFAQTSMASLGTCTQTNFAGGPMVVTSSLIDHIKWTQRGPFLVTNTSTAGVYSCSNVTRGAPSELVGSSLSCKSSGWCDVIVPSTARPDPDRGARTLAHTVQWLANSFALGFDYLRVIGVANVTTVARFHHQDMVESRFDAVFDRPAMVNETLRTMHYRARWLTRKQTPTPSDFHTIARTRVNLTTPVYVVVAFSSHEAYHGRLLRNVQSAAAGDGAVELVVVTPSPHAVACNTTLTCHHVPVSGNFSRAGWLHAGIHRAGLLAGDTTQAIAFTLDTSMLLPMDAFVHVRSATLRGQWAFAPLCLRIEGLTSHEEALLPLTKLRPKLARPVHAGYGMAAFYVSDYFAAGGYNLDLGTKWGHEDVDLVKKFQIINVHWLRYRWHGFYHVQHKDAMLTAYNRNQNVLNASTNAIVPRAQPQRAGDALWRSLLPSARLTPTAVYAQKPASNKGAPFTYVHIVSRGTSHRHGNSVYRHVFETNALEEAVLVEEVADG